MNRYIERKIEEIFKYEGKKYIVKELNNTSYNLCLGCAFDTIEEECKVDKNLRDIIGLCGCTIREDGKNIIFKEVKEEQKQKDKKEYTFKALETAQKINDDIYLVYLHQSKNRERDYGNLLFKFIPFLIQGKSLIIINENKTGGVLYSSLLNAKFLYNKFVKNNTQYEFKFVNKIRESDIYVQISFSMVLKPKKEDNNMWKIKN